MYFSKDILGLKFIALNNFLLLEKIPNWSLGFLFFTLIKKFLFFGKLMIYPADKSSIPIILIFFLIILFMNELPIKPAQPVTKIVFTNKFLFLILY